MHNDISYIWTRFNRRWLASGFLAGVGAGLVALALAAFLSANLAREISFPAKLIGAVLLGSDALAADSLIGGTTGFLIHLTLSGFFGLVFAQFVLETSRKRNLLLLGTLAGLAVWLFWSMMFMPSFNEAMFFFLPKTVSLLLHLAFGFSFGLFVVLLRPLFVVRCA